MPVTCREQHLLHIEQIHQYHNVASYKKKVFLASPRKHTPGNNGCVLDSGGADHGGLMTGFCELIKTFLIILFTCKLLPATDYLFF